MLVSTGLNDRTVAPPSGSPMIAPVVHIAQQVKSFWCWAAVISSITQSKPTPPSPYTSQCLLAYQTYGGGGASELSQADCCQSGSAGNICNNPLSPAWIAGAYAPAAPSPLTIAGIAAQPPSQTDNTISDDAIINALRQNKPICIVINWPSGQLHFVAIVGASMVNGQLTYAIGDPYDGSINWFDRVSINNYHSQAGSGGTWLHTYVTI
jgi:hypothetical protein